MIKFNERRLRFIFDSRSGPVGRSLARKGIRIESVAKQFATEAKLVRTGRYRASIAWSFTRDATGLGIRVGSAVPHARLLEHGTPPHRIPVSGTANPRLFWTHGADRGWFVPEHPLRFVNHPGTQPYNIIRRAVQRVLIFG